MPEIIQASSIAGGGLADPFYNAGVPSNGTSEIWTVTIGGTPTGGTFVLSCGPNVSAAISWSSTNATLLANIQAALVALGTVGASGVVAAAGTLAAGIGTLTLTFGGNLAVWTLPTNFVAVVSNSMTGTAPTIAAAQTTAGVTATARGAAKGAECTDITNGKIYINTGTGTAPTWVSVGSQT